MNTALLDKLLFIFSLVILISVILKITFKSSGQKHVKLLDSSFLSSLKHLFMKKWWLFILVPFVYSIIFYTLKFYNVYGEISPKNDESIYFIGKMFKFEAQISIIEYLKLTIGSVIENILNISEYFIYFSLFIFIYGFIVSNKKKNAIIFSMILGINILIVIITALSNSLFFAIFLAIISFIASSFVISFLLVLFFNVYLDKNLEKDELFDKVFKHLFQIIGVYTVYSVLINCGRFLNLFIPDLNLNLPFSGLFFFLILNLYLIFYIPRLVIFERSFVIEMKETFLYLCTNFFSIIKVLIFLLVLKYSFSFIDRALVLNYFQSIPILVLDSFIRFLLRYPVGIFSFMMLLNLIIKSSGEVPEWQSINDFQPALEEELEMEIE